jgi:hypothetical protein
VKLAKGEFLFPLVKIIKNIPSPLYQEEIVKLSPLQIGEGLGVRFQKERDSVRSQKEKDKITQNKNTLSFSGLTRESFKEIKFTNLKSVLLKNSDNGKNLGTNPRMTQVKAFTLVELIVIITIVAIL